MSNYNTVIEKYQGALPKKKKYIYSKIIRCNNVIDVVRMTREPEIHIKKLDKHNYVNLKTGEVNGFMPKIEGVQFRNIRSLKVIFRDLRQLITTNFEGEPCEKFLTLTYREQTNDPKKIYSDLDKFNKRLKWHHPSIAYLHIVEPHASGNFHVHSLLKRCDGEPLDMTYEEAFKLWGHGYVTVETLQHVDYIGAYFIAYFSNMELTAAQVAQYEAQDDIKEKDGKKFIKGKRLDFYPDYMKIYRGSKNLKKPEAISGVPDKFIKTHEAQYKITTTDADGNMGETYIEKSQHKKKKKT